MKPSVLLVTLLIAATGIAAQEVKREVIYGAELMTRIEREEYRRNLQRAETEDAAQKVRARHREQMQKRARARGEKLDDAGLLVRKEPEKQKRERKGPGK